jgi:DnaJ-class molecular chaperone
MRVPSDPYADLGIPRDASPAEITHAFRELLRRHHPDTRSARDAASSAHSDAALQRILAAYTALSTKRPSAGRGTGTSDGPVVAQHSGADASLRFGPIRWRAGTARNAPSDPS